MKETSVWLVPLVSHGGLQWRPSHIAQLNEPLSVSLLSPPPPQKTGLAHLYILMRGNSLRLGVPQVQP